MNTDKPFLVPIKKIITENARVKSFQFDLDLPSKAGQFVMTWIPGYDEKPFGIVKKNGKFMITVAAVGDSTNALHNLKVGDKIGFRGPYGSFFHLTPSKKSIAMVAGGYGMASLAQLVEEAIQSGKEVHLFLGARTKDELLYKSWMEKIGAKLHPSTDDGSEGFKGYNTILFEKEIESIHPEMVYVVGPEIMEVKIAKICYEKQIPFEISLERYMKCGIGICGQCCVDPTGWRMSVEGPVLNEKQLLKVTEFGKYHRSASGKIINY